MHVRKLLLIAILAASVSAQEDENLPNYGVPPRPESLFQNCFFDQPLHGPGADHCGPDRAVTIEQAEKYYRSGFKQRGWQLQNRTTEHLGSGAVTRDIVEMTWVRADCGQDYPTQFGPTIGRAAKVTISRDPRGAETYLEYFEGLEGEFQQYRNTDTACRVFVIASNPSLSTAQKKERLRVVQESIGAQAFAAALRLFPVYDKDVNNGDGGVVTLDSYLRKLGRELNPSGANTPLNQDPIGAEISMIMNPSMENIARQTGIPWPP